jgi:cobalt-zinc-cadmium efflux system outer membrane protein
MRDSKINLLFAAFFALLLGACAEQAYVAKPIVAEQSATLIDSRRLESEALQTFMQDQGYPSQSLPVKSWGLPELTLAAIYYSPKIKVATAQWEAQQAGEITAAQRLNPGLDLSATHHTRTDGGISPWTLGFSLSIPIETRDKRALRIQRASQLSEAAKLDIGQTLWQVRSDLRRQYIDYQGVSQKLVLLEREVKLREDIDQMLEHRVEAGMASNIELNNVRLQLQKARQALQLEYNTLPNLRAAIAETIGIPVAAMDHATLGALPAANSITVPNFQRDVLLNRLDIRAALAHYAATETKLQLEIAKQHPDFTLNPGYTYDQGDQLWTLGLSTLLAFLNKNEGPIAEAMAQRTLEIAQFNALQLRVISQADQARIRYQTALDETTQTQKLAEAQKQRSMQTEHQFDAGYTDRLELALARLEEITAEQAALAATIKAQQALGDIEDAAQKPMDNTMMPSLPERKDSTS